MLIKQLSVFVENSTGELKKLTTLLAENGVDIRALSMADTTDYGVLRLIVGDPERAQKILRDNGKTVALTEVIAAMMEDKPGGLSKVMDIMAKENINIEYMYAFVNPRSSDAFTVFRVEDNEKTINVLQKHGINIVTAEEFTSR